MKSFTPIASINKSRAFLASILTCIMLVTPLTPVGFASTTQSRSRAKSAAQQPAEPKPAAPATQTRNAQQTPPIARNLAAGDITATKTDTILNDTLGDGKAQAGDTIKYNITITNNGTTDALNVTLNDPLDPGGNTSLVSNSIHAAPQARNDAYTTVGNTLLEVGVAAGAAPAVRVTGSVFDNDASATDTRSLASFTQPANGTLTFNSDGTFTYLPNAGFTGPTDSFTYTVKNDADNTLTDTATVTITISGRVWYVNNAVANGDGRSTSPFNSLTPVNGAGGAGDSDAINDVIYLFQGSGAYTTGITLENGQQLIGNGVNLVVSTFTLRNGSLAQRPTITNGTGHIITLAQNNTVRGLNTGDTTNIDITGTNFGTFTADNIAILGTGRPLSLTTGTLAATFDQITSTNSSGGQGILLQTNVAGSMTVTNGTTITGSATQGILVTQSTANVNFGNTSVTGGTDGISLSNNSAGTRTFGTITRSGGTGVGFLHAVGGGITNITGTTTISGTGGRGIDIEDSTTPVTFTNVSVTTAGGTGVFLEDNSGAITFADFDVTPSNNQKAVTINNSTGLVTATSGDLSATGNSVLEITGPAGRTPLAMSLTSLASTNNANAGGFGVNINFTSGTFTVTGTTNIQNPAGVGLQIQNSTANFNFQGTTTSDASGGTGVFLNANSGNVTFPALGITPDSGQRALHATANTGALTTTSGTISTTNQTAVEIVGTAPGTRTPLNVQLTSVSALASGGNPPNGIVVTNTSTTGSPGGFRILGSGGVCTEATPTCTGGHIQNTTGGDVNPVTTSPTGTGVVLRDANSISLTNIRINGNTNYGIHGLNVNGFTLASSVVHGANGSNVSSPFRDSSIRFDQLSGTTSITNSLITGGHQHNLLIDNQSGTAQITVSGNTIKNTSAAAGDDGFQLEAETSAVVNAFVTNNAFSAHGGDHFNLSMLNNADVDLTFTGNSFAGGHAIGLSQGLFILGATFNGSFTYDISNNGTAAAPLVGNRQVGMIHVNKGSGTATYNGRITNNFIGNAAINHSGSLEAFGIIVGARGAGGTHNTLISNNSVRQYHDRGILLEAGEGSAALNATVTNNTVDNFADPTNSLHGIHSDNGILTTDTNAVCMDIQDNLVANAGNEPQGGADIRLRKGTQAGLSVRIPGLVGTTSTDADNKITAENPNATTVTVSGVGFTGGGACTQPTLPAPPAAAPVILTSEASASTSSQATLARSGDITSRPFVSLPQAAQALPQARTNTEKVAAKQDGAQTSKAAPGNDIQPLQAAFPVIIPVLQPGESVTITLQVTVNSGIANNVTSVSNQGQITSTSFAGTVLTDDPTVGGANDPTVTDILPRPTYTINDASIPEPATGSANMPFTVTLSHAYGSTVSVSFATTDGTATAGSDYVSTTGTLSFDSGQLLQTISVAVLANGDTSDENFTVTLSNPVNSVLGADSTAVGTITEANPPGRVLISEVRTSGPGGPGDDFIELYNNQDVAQDISGWAIFKSGATCLSTPVLVAVIPAATTIPARGHYLIVGPQYSLTTSATGNATVAAVTDIEADRNLGLFNTSNPLSLSTATREDAVGFSVNAGGSNNCDLLREGATLLSANGSASQHSFARNLVTGLPKETNDSAADFLVVSTTPAVAVGDNLTPALGAPGPENLASPIQRNGVIKASLIDGTVAATAPPNRVRSGIIDPGGPNAFGTLSIQRRFKNTLGVPVTRLRFRIVDLTTINNRPPGNADLRVLSSTGVVKNSAGTTVATVTGLTLEGPAQPNGGGLNSTLTVIPPGGALAAGASIDVQFLLGVQEQGAFSFFVNVEALAPGSAASQLPSADLKNGSTQKQVDPAATAPTPKPQDQQ